MPSALFLAHPGHELFVHEWMRRESPLVYILTDGSGRSDRPRIEDSRRTLAAAGATLDPSSAAISDLELYASLSSGDKDFFVSLAQQWARLLVDHRIDTIVGDACERRYLAHDFMRVILDAAVAMAERDLGQTIRSLAFPMYGYYGEREPKVPAAQTITLVMDDAALEQKRLAAASCRQEGLHSEMVELLKSRGLEFFREETLVAAHWSVDAAARETLAPEYEEHGRRLAAEGVYASALTETEHVLPIRKALAELLGR